MDNDINWDSEIINFDFEIGYTPEFKINLKPKKPILKYEVKADKKMVDGQIKNIQSQYGKLISKPKAENNSITLFKSPSEKSTISEANNAKTP